MHNCILIFSAGRAIIKEREDRKNNKPIKGGKEDNMKKIVKVTSPAENAIMCYYGFCKRKAVAIGGKREVTRLKIATYLLNLFYRSGGDLDGLTVVMKKASDFSDADCADLLMESVSGAFEFPTDVENGAKKAYKNMNYYLDSNRQQVFLSEVEFQKAKNAEMCKRIANYDFTLIADKIATILAPSELEIFVCISNGESIRAISSETGIPKSTLHRYINDLRIKLSEALDPDDYKKIF